MTACKSAARWPIHLFHWFRGVAQWLRAIVRGLREITGDDAYERYLEHWHRHHANLNQTVEKPLGRRDFLRQRENERWNGVRRCC